MRPTPQEVIAGVRALLREEIAPALDPAAEKMLKRIMAVLRDGRWNEAAFDLLRENAAFADSARACAARVAAQDALAPVAAALDAAAALPVARTFAEANAANHALRTALARFIEAVRDRNLVALDDLCADIAQTMLRLGDVIRG